MCGFMPQTCSVSLQSVLRKNCKAGAWGGQNSYHSYNSLSFVIVVAIWYSNIEDCRDRSCRRLGSEAQSFSSSLTNTVVVIFVNSNSIVTSTRFHTHRLPRLAATKCRFQWQAQGIRVLAGRRELQQTMRILDVYATLSALRLHALP